MMRWHVIGVIGLAGAMAAPNAVWAELVGQAFSLGTELTINQPGSDVTLYHDNAMIDLVLVQYAQVGPAPFDIQIERMNCAPEVDGIYLRMLDAAVLPEVVGLVNEAASLGSFADTITAVFPPGYGLAAEAGPLTDFSMDSPTDPTFDQGFNFVIDDRFAMRDGTFDVITVGSVVGDGRDYLAEGAPFVMLIGRNACNPGDGRVLLDLIAFNIDAG